MGIDKASLKIGGITLLERTISVVKPLVNQTIVMLADKQDISYLSDKIQCDVTFGRDRIEAKGPLRGICDGVKLLDDSITEIFVLSCDLPYLSSDWLKRMQNNMTDCLDVIYAVNGKIINPLIAYYRREVLDRAAFLIRQGRRRPLDLWEGFRVKELSSDLEEDYTISDVNTPEEYQKAVRFYNDK